MKRSRPRSNALLKPDRDTGRTPPEVIAEVETHRSQGCALDLGCGTGAHAMYLARQGFSLMSVWYRLVRL